MSDFREDDLFYEETITEAQRKRKENRKQPKAKSKKSVKEKEEKPVKEKKKRTPAQLRRRRIIALGVFVLLVGVGSRVVSSLWQLKQLSAEKEQAEKTLQSNEEKRSALEQELELVESDEYVEEAARWQLGMTRPGELKIVIRRMEKAKENKHEADAEGEDAEN